jgi:hypothetical protein
MIITQHTTQVADASRIRASMPTILYLARAGARVVLLSHLGRPHGKVDVNFSLAPVAVEVRLPCWPPDGPSTVPTSPPRGHTQPAVLGAHSPSTNCFDVVKNCFGVVKNCFDVVKQSQRCAPRVSRHPAVSARGVDRVSSMCEAVSTRGLTRGCG